MILFGWINSSYWQTSCIITLCNLWIQSTYLSMQPQSFLVNDCLIIMLCKRLETWVILVVSEMYLYGLICIYMGWFAFPAYCTITGHQSFWEGRMDNILSQTLGCWRDYLAWVFLLSIKNSVIRLLLLLERRESDRERDIGKRK